MIHKVRSVDLKYRQRINIFLPVANFFALKAQYPQVSIGVALATRNMRSVSVVLNKQPVRVFHFIKPVHYVTIGCAVCHTLPRRRNERFATNHGRRKILQRQEWPLEESIARNVAPKGLKVLPPIGRNQLGKDGLQLLVSRHSTCP